MTRVTHGIRIGCTGVIGLALAGCAQNGQSNQQQTRAAPTRAAQAAPAPAPAPSGPMSPVTAAANMAGAVVNAATGAVTGAVTGASATPAKNKGPRIKPDGRGGYDASELQADAIRRAHQMTARYGTTGYSKINGRPTPVLNKPTTQPVTQPTGH